MKTKLIREFDYNGFGFTSHKLPYRKQVEVEILGVMIPVDPGMVTISWDPKTSNGTRQVPTFVLEQCPDFDFEAMLSFQQREEREHLGGLLFQGATDHRKPKLIPLAQCPIKV